MSGGDLAQEVARWRDHRCPTVDVAHLLRLVREYGIRVDNSTKHRVQGRADHAIRWAKSADEVYDEIREALTGGTA